MSAPSLLRPLALLLLSLAGSAAALSPPPDPPPPPATIWIPPESGLQPIRLDQVRIDVRTEGFLARTRIELDFFNPNARVLEGEFVFPLGAGQTVSGYELEVDGALRAGVVVPKQTARVAYENTIRQQIDPGLAEFTRGNVFRTRLYPIPANGHKRIALSFEQAMDDGGDHYRYLLPLAFRDVVREFRVRAEARRVDAAPSDASASPDAALRFDRVGEAWSAELVRNDVRPQRELAFRIPKAGTEATAIEAVDVRDPAWRSVVAQFDSGRAQQRHANTTPRRVALWIDASGSARERDRARENAALARWLGTLGTVQVDLVAFRDAAEAPRGFRVIDGDARALLAAIEALPLDGGSSYGAIDPALTPQAQLLLVIGDGLSNFGPSEPRAARAGHAVVHVLHAAQRADHARLARIARSGGGQVLDLLRLDTNAALAALQRPSWQLRRVQVEGGECTDLSPRAGAAVDAMLTLSARCRGRGTLQLEFGQGDQRVTRRIGFGTRAPVGLELEPAVHRLWAAAHLAELEADAPRDRSTLTALATRHAVVSADTSLLVLDRIEDYVRYRVEPPEPGLLAQYRALVANEEKALAADTSRADRIASLLAQWKEFRDWHAQPHAWLETLLAPTAQAESVFWSRIAAGDAAAQAHAKQAAELRTRSDTLAARWRRDGAEPASRAAWEREATELMLQVDALRRERLRRLPESAQWNPNEAQIVANDAAPPPPGVAVESGEDMDRIEVTGSRIMRAEAESAAPVMAARQAAPAEPSPAPGAPAAKALDDLAAAGAGPAPTQARIELAGWNPDTPYLAAIRAGADPYATYLQQRELHGTAPAFFLDVADHFRDQVKDPVLARRILSNVAELGLDQIALVRVLGYRLMQWDEFALAAGQFEEALRQRPEEPQSYRDLALALARSPQRDVARAIALLWQVASGEWHGRFPGIEVIALHELNDVLATAPDRAGVKLDALQIPPELIEPLAVGLRVAMTWDADNTDIDLWVTDPTGTRVYYGDARSPSGGHVSRDFTQGYGPEVYTIRRPLPGTYRVQAHYFGDRRQSLTGPVTVQLEFQTNFGAAGSTRAAVTRRLEEGSQDIEIGSFTVE
jgi:Ca-activated chloride channel family protein